MIKYKCLIILSLVFCFYALEVKANVLVSEYQLKAKFLYNFARFVQWPKFVWYSPKQAMTLCLLGMKQHDIVMKNQLQDKSIKYRKINILSLKLSELQQLPQCQILFIAVSMENQLPSILAKTRKYPILTVGETEDFTQKGGMIGFINILNRLRFYINVKAARKVGLKIDSKLLKLVYSK